MTDYDRTLKPGETQVIRRPPKDGKWQRRSVINLEPGDTATIRGGDIIIDPPPPDPDPPPAGALRGFGRNVVLSTAPEQTVTSLTALRAAVNGGKNVKVDVAAGTVWDLAGNNLNVKSNTRVDFGNLVLRGGAVFLQSVSNVYLENLRSHPGDESGNADELDALSINGNRGPVRNIYVRNSQFLWAPDVLAAILGDVADVTFERCVFAEGLYQSDHSEAPHSLGPNVASQDPDTPAQRISFIECLTATNQSRNFRLIGVDQAEVIGCTVYNHNEGPQGSPTSAMLLGCTWKKGPNPLANTRLFRAQDGGHGAFSARPNSVYLEEPSVIGFVDSGVDPKVKANAPLFTPTEPTPDPKLAHSIVLAAAGAYPADRQLTRIRQDVANGAGQYVNGTGKPAPNPEWP